MIVVDTSAIVAIAFGEPEREAFVQAIQTSEKALISTVSGTPPAGAALMAGDGR